jgi:erythromycin esterase
MKLFLVYLLPLITIISTANAQIKTLILGQPIEKSITTGERHNYNVNLDAGGYSLVTVDDLGIWLIITAYDPNGEKMQELDITDRNQSKQYIKIKATISGNHRLQITPWEGYSQTVRYGVKLEELLTPFDYEKRLEIEYEKQNAVIQWLKENAIALEGVEARQGFEDMQLLKKIVGKARLVALGEATHGTREFFQLKHRMLEFLVNEMKFNIFAIEGSMPEAFDINEYVLTGKGDPEKALAGLYFWTWNTEEVLDMIRWMRNYNADPSHTKKVKFYGMDTQWGTRAVKVTIDYMKKVNYQLANKLNENIWLSRIKNPFTYYDYSGIIKEKEAQTRKIIDLVMKEMNSNKKDYIFQSSKKEWDLAQVHLRILEQYINSSNRDSIMAANVQWILEREGIDSKIVIWAHNLHVNNHNKAMGKFLKEKYGDDIVIFGFAFNQGSFQARGAPTWLTELRPYHVKPLPDGSLDATLGSTGLPFAVIDLRKIPKTGLVKDWFAVEHSTRILGPGYIKSFRYADLQQVQQRYDALLFVDETTAARPNPGG